MRCWDKKVSIISLQLHHIHSFCTLTKACKIGDISNHSGTPRNSIHRPFQQVNIPVYLSLIHLVSLKSITNNLTSRPECMKWSHDVMKCAGKEVIQHP